MTTIVLANISITHKITIFLGGSHMTCVVPQLTETYVRTKTQVFTAAVFIMAKTHNNQSVYP